MKLAIVLIIVVVILIWIFTTYNRFVKLRNTVQEAFATMDVFLKKRFDLIPNLVESVKGYKAHESETLQKVVQARSALANTSGTEDQLAKENILSGTLRSLFAVSEAYPDLKANTEFMRLMDELRGIEDEIANSRKYYNAVVKKLNIAVESFPSNIIAAMFKIEKATMFEAPAESRENVKVSFE